VPPLVVVTPYGREGGSSRVRVYDWLDHLGLVEEAARVEKAAVADIAARTGQGPRSTTEIGDAIAAAV